MHTYTHAQGLLRPVLFLIQASSAWLTLAATYTELTAAYTAFTRKHADNKSVYNADDKRSKTNDNTFTTSVDMDRSSDINQVSSTEHIPLAHKLCILAASTAALNLVYRGPEELTWPLRNVLNTCVVIVLSRVLQFQTTKPVWSLLGFVVGVPAGMQL